MLERPLDDAQQRLLVAVRRCLGDFGVDLARLAPAPEDAERLRRALRQLDEPFALVIVGEFNSGKSTFINALLGEALLEEGVTPTTQRLHVVTHAAAAPPESERDLVHVTASAEWLRDVRLVDTPGTNAIAREHEALTVEYVPRADLVLFVTSADRPFTESERLFLESIREWGKKVTIVLNKIDIFESDAELERVSEFVAESARGSLRLEAPVRSVSARLALRSKLGSADQGAWVASRFGDIEDQIRRTLEERPRFRLKLLNPLGVATKLAASCAESVAVARELLREDIEALDDVDRQLVTYRGDLTRDFRFRMADVDNALHEFDTRGSRFFDETLRLGRVFDLLNKERTQAAFAREVIGDVPSQVEARVSEIIDWLVESEMRQWRGISERLQRRSDRHGERVLGSVAGAIETDRARLLDTVGRAARSTVEDYDREAEGRRIAESIRSAVASVALLGAGAVGLGAAVTLIASSTAADVTGILAASSLALIGLFVIPAKRKRAKRELREQIRKLRERLSETITAQFEKEVDRIVRQIENAIAPYSRFVRTEQERLLASGAALERHHVKLGELTREAEEC